MGEISLLVLLLVFSGVFSGSETALVALSMARAEALLRENRRGAHALHELKRDPQRMLITILIGNNVVNIGASALATVIATERFGSIGPGIAVGVLTLLILVFGEITPKTLATRYSERISLLIAPPMMFFMRMIYPLVLMFRYLTEWLGSLMRLEHDPTVTEQELISMVEHGQEEGTIEKDEREFIERIFTFTDLKVIDVMTPRHKVFSLDGKQPVGEALHTLINEPFSRIPIFDEDPDDIVAVLYLRDVLRAVASGDTTVPLRELAQEPHYAPENQSIKELISKMQRDKRHLAIVIDEHGTLQGVVTMEDLLEEIVGEIYDESDKLPFTAETQGDTRITIEGAAELRVVEEFFEVDLPGKPTDTVNRWLLGHTERIPEKGESFDVDGLRVEVKSASRRHIREVMISRSPQAPGTEAPTAP